MIVTIDSRLKKLENEIQQLKTELSIVIEYYGEVREFLNQLTQLTKSSELSYSKPSSILESVSTQTSKPKSKLDSMLDQCINLIFKDYKDQFKE
jgi:archaellum component FlaC